MSPREAVLAMGLSESPAEVAVAIAGAFVCEEVAGRADGDDSSQPDAGCA